MQLDQQIAVITGASSGIGRALAVAMAQEGAIVIAVARRSERLQRLIDDIRIHSPKSCYLAGDIGQQDFAEGIVEETVRRFGRVDLVINNAAIPMHQSLEKILPDEAERVMKVNFMACVWTVLAALPHMRRQGGGILVNVSSFATKVVPTHESIYVASKCAMNGFTAASGMILPARASMPC